MQSGKGFVTVFPCGQRNAVSSLNLSAGATVANAVIAPVSPSGTVCFYSSVDTNLLADVNGWFAGGESFSPVVPERVFDTRVGEAGLRPVAKIKVGGAQVVDVKVTDLIGAGGRLVPAAGVGAVSLNVTATDSDGAGFVTVFPCGERNAVSSLNVTVATTVANAVIAPVSASGTVCFYSSVATNLLADVNGWFAG